MLNCFVFMLVSFSNSISRDHLETEAKKAAAERYFAYAKEKLDELTAGARTYYESQRPPVEVEEDTVASRTTKEQDAALSLVAFSHGDTESTESAQTELASLQSLQESIENRIQFLQDAQRQEA